MVENLPRLSRFDIEDWVGKRSFEKGLDYAGSGAILNPRRQGTLLKASCAGSGDSLYRLEVTLAPGGILAGECSCPVGSGGQCKHVAALLLEWLEDPGSFVEVEDLDTALERRSREELVALVRQMIRRDPDLELLLELPSPSSTAAGQAVDPEMIRRQVDQAFQGSFESWDDPEEIVRALEPVLDLGEQYAAQSDVSNAAIVFMTLAREVLDYELAILQDEQGYLHGLIGHCTEELGKCLEAIQDPEQRENVLSALLDIYAWNVDAGGLGLADIVPDILCERTNPSERQTIANWIQERLPAGDDWQDRYRRQVWGTLWLNLEAEWLDDEAFLQICRQTGLSLPLVERLIQLGRVDDAADEARQASDADLLPLADLLVAGGEAALAESLVRQRVEVRPDKRLLAWLEEHHRK